MEAHRKSFRVTQKYSWNSRKKGTVGGTGEASALSAGGDVHEYTISSTDLLMERISKDFYHYSFTISIVLW